MLLLVTLFTVLEHRKAPETQIFDMIQLGSAWNWPSLQPSYRHTLPCSSAQPINICTDSQRHKPPFAGISGGQVSG